MATKSANTVLPWQVLAWVAVILAAECGLIYWLLK